MSRTSDPMTMLIAEEDNYARVNPLVKIKAPANWKARGFMFTQKIIGDRCATFTLEKLAKSSNN